MSRKFSAGSLSLLLVMLAVLWSCNLSLFDGKCLGDYVLNSLGVPAWSNGDTGIHYSVYYSLILLIPAFILGNKKPSDLFAAFGKWLSGIMLSIMLIAFLFMAW